MLDVKLFLRVRHDLLQRRREERQTYVLQSEYLYFLSALQYGAAGSILMIR
jgi:hypothetical protein